MRISKSDGTETYLPQDELDSERRKKLIALYNNKLYYNNYLEGGDITALSLDNFSEYKIEGLSLQSTEDGFLGIKRELSRNSFGNGLTVMGLFTNGSDYFVVDNTSVYQIKNGKPRLLINGGLYGDRLCYDGKRIYYIDGLLQLNCYDISSGKTNILDDELVQVVYYDGTRLLFSDRNGIFALDTDDFSTEKLSSKTADSISSDGENIVYSSGGALYLLSENEIKLTDNAPVSYAVVSGLNKVLTAGGDNEIAFDLIEIPSND